MTHRSRSGGPGPQQKGRKAPGAKKKPGRKLHHPPPPPSAEPDQPTEPTAESASDSESDDETLPARVFKEKPSNQGILNALDKAIRYDERFPEHVQKAKALLFERRWLDLFLDRELLDAYAGRWVPSRALMFRSVMADVKPVRALFSPPSTSDATSDGEDDDNDAEEPAAEETNEKENGEEKGKENGAETKRILSIGGGAGSELLAIAALCVTAQASVEWVGVDIGDWGSVIERLADSVKDWEIPASFEFVEADVLKLPLSDAPKPGVKSSTPLTTTTTTTAATATESAATDGTPNGVAEKEPPKLPKWLELKPDLTTIFFTLTELLSQSRPRTINLLRHLTSSTPVGGHLLILDSASDIAEFPLGNSDRTWPVHMITDALLGGLAVPKGSWRKVRSEDSRWFRLDGTERWGRCKLENGRYWLRLYERC